jgi:hypothetical protein
MYVAVYDAMVAAKVARKLDYDLIYNKDGENTDKENEMVGQKTRYKLTHPYYLLMKPVVIQI